MANGSRLLRPGRRLGLIMLVGVSVLAFAAPVWAVDVFYRVPVNELQLTDGKIPAPQNEITPGWQRSNQIAPWASVEAGEAYLEYPGSVVWNAYDWQARPGENTFVLVRAPQGKDVSGVLVVPSADMKSMVPLKFTIPRKLAADEVRNPFYRAKLAHYQRLLGRDAPGNAWFRHQTRAARVAVGEAVANQIEAQVPRRVRADNLDETYNLFTGGRALSENLQLDRVIPAARQVQEPSVPIDTLSGIDVKGMDWGPLIKDKRPQVDPLASRIPMDQHAVFFPSFNAMMALVDEADTQGVPILQALEPRAEDARTKERYQKQLCLSLTGMSRILGPRAIDSIAVTGSDPYLRVGSDVAILFEAKDVEVLKNLFTAQLAMWRQREPAAKQVEGKAGRLTYFGQRSPDRSICAYVAQLGDSNVLVVTNSLPQLERLSATLDGSVPPISEAPEYTFFRDRYKRGEEHESAFVVLTDATIRRWCGPRWRIADSRRTQAAAVLAELQAKHMTALAGGKVEPAVIPNDRPVPEMGDVFLSPAGVASSTYGSLDYGTPIIELPMDKVTPAEADLYRRWRDGYQQNWSNYFDPIAIRLSVHEGRLAADMTVMPLIAGTDYKTWIELTQGAKLAPDAGDPHDALLHFAIAINRDSGPVKEVSALAKQIAPKVKIEPLGWLGQAVSLYVDDDPIWAEAAKAPDVDKFLNDNWHRVPVAVYAKSDNPFKLAAFMTAVHAYVDQSAPNITRWETQEYKEGVSYVKVFSKGSGVDAVDRVSLYYATTPEALVLTVNEDVMKRALDRQAARRQAKEKGGEGGAGEGAAAKFEPWLGEHVAIQIDTKGILAARAIFGRNYRQKMQELAWSNLPILNEWKRLYPDQDPVKLHERLWQTRLVDPAGGRYVWNEQYQTMESTSYGHPGAPKDGPGLPPQVDAVTRAGLGVTFEHQGLRARAVMERKAK